ncbi:hypothetical protein BDP27DRAFT_1322580, partial [Rhodocollybia butyracea]
MDEHFPSIRCRLILSIVRTSLSFFHQYHLLFFVLARLNLSSLERPRRFTVCPDSLVCFYCPVNESSSSQPRFNQLSAICRSSVLQPLMTVRCPSHSIHSFQKSVLSGTVVTKNALIYFFALQDFLIFRFIFIFSVLSSHLFVYLPTHARTKT